MAKTNRFHVKKIEDEINYTVEEERKDRSPFYLFFRRNMWLMLGIVLLLSIIFSTITIYAVSKNIKGTSNPKYEDSGVVATFDKDNNSILDGIPITKEYASKLFDGVTKNEPNRGVVIRVKEVELDFGKIIYYSDKTALIKYNNGTYVKIERFGNDYGVSEDGTINSGAKSKNVGYEYKNNDELGITLLYLSDGTVEITKDNVVMLLRNTDLTSNSDKFFTNLSGVSVPTSKEGNKIIFSDGSIKENDYIIINGEKHFKTKEESIHDNIKIIYYDNGYAEVIEGELDILAQKSEHIKYDDNIFEIVEGNTEVNIENFIDIKTVELDNKNDKKVSYAIVLEETSDYSKHNVSRILKNDYINYVLNIKGNKETGKLDNNIKNSSEFEGLNLTNNTFLLYEGTLESFEKTDVKIGLWISYENITNEYMNSAFIGTLKVYME